MFTNRISKILIVVFVLAAALATVTFAVRAKSLPAADRAYDAIEGVRLAAVQADRTYDEIEAARDNRLTFTAYDQIESLRLLRVVNPVAVSAGYDAVEQVRLGREFNADHSYDQIETLRLSR